MLKPAAKIGRNMKFNYEKDDGDGYYLLGKAKHILKIVWNFPRFDSIENIVRP